MKSQERVWEDILISNGLGMGVGLLHAGRLVYQLRSAVESDSANAARVRCSSLNSEEAKPPRAASLRGLRLHVRRKISWFLERWGVAFSPLAELIPVLQ